MPCSVDMKKLDDLPEELISNISVRLHTDDISAFRLTCRALEKKSFHEFGKEYFTEKCFMFTTDSLKVLVGISNSDRLRGFLQKVHFMTALFSKRALECKSGCRCPWQPSIKQKEAYRDYVEDQKTLGSTGRDKEMLMESFSNLTHLESLIIDDMPSMLPSDVDYRGRNKVPRTTGRQPTMGVDAATDKEFKTFFRHVFKVIMQAMSASTTVTYVATNLARGSNGLPIAYLDTKKFQESAISLNRLKHVVLRFRAHNPTPLPPPTALEQSDTARQTKVIKRFASTLTSLEALDLLFDSGERSGSWFLGFANSINLGNLTSLRLEGMFIDAAPLAQIIGKLASVKDIRFMFVNLTKGNWPTILKMLQKLTGHLTHVHLMYLLEKCRKVYFLKQHKLDPWDPAYDEDVGMSDEELSDYWDEEFDTDDDMPDLEPAGNATFPSDAMIPSVSNGFVTVDSSNNAGENSQPAPISHSNEHHKNPDDLESPERGYFVCLQNEQIAAQLPTFIEEYNLGETMEDELGPLPPGAPQTLQQFVNMLGNTMGMPPPPPPPPPAGGAAPAPAPPAAAPQPAAPQAPAPAAGPVHPRHGFGGRVSGIAVPLGLFVPPVNAPQAAGTGATPNNAPASAAPAAAAASVAAHQAGAATGADADEWTDEEEIEIDDMD